MNNYRPISILPALSKILKKAVATQLTKHLESNTHLHPLQFGFRAKFSTESANCFLLEQIKSYIDKGNLVGAVFLDLKKAFDTVNHNVLLSTINQGIFLNQNWNSTGVGVRTNTHSVCLLMTSLIHAKGLTFKCMQMMRLFMPMVKQLLQSPMS